MRRSVTDEDRRRRLAVVLDVAPWAAQLVETLAGLPETDQDAAISFVEHLAERHRSQKA